ATLREKVETDPSSAPEETRCHAIFREIHWPADSRHQFRMLCARWLEEIRNGDPDLSAAARALSIPPATLSIRLRKTIGLTYSGCRSALRLELARRELESSDKPIRLVAEAVGLSDPANLHRLFRRHGLPAPGLYRWLTRAPGRKS
ncbi:MAG TPA: AraC family transcriptional regulator, partial [Candidatus Hydrogenedentes bacterium]|nr:AraC family transcriptional regulator [Candidatus Hydrogenedentota bacterium]